MIITPTKDKEESDEVFRTYSIKKEKSDKIRIILANPSLSEKIVNINKMRFQIGVPLIEVIGVEIRN